jgi:hypothetical protein
MPAHSLTAHVSNSHVIVIDADPRRVRDGVARHDAGAPLSQAAAFLAGGGIDVTFDIEVDAAEDRTYVAATTRFRARDEDARERLLDAWGTLGPVATALVRRALDAIKHSAEGAEVSAPPRVLAFAA